MHSADQCKTQKQRSSAYGMAGFLQPHDLEAGEVKVAAQPVLRQALEIMGSIMDRVQKWHAEKHRPTGFQHTCKLGQRSLWMADMLQYFQTNNRINTSFDQGQMGRIGKNIRMRSIETLPRRQ